jgi:uncharacterized protein (DUF488 family)
MAGLEIMTIGHSTHPIGEFIEILAAHHVEQIADVRTVPRSRHNPQFNKDVLPDSLLGSGIDYIHLAGLGGLRHSRKDSVNTAWKNASFRGYADYMQTPEFAQALDGLINIAAMARTAVMCAEAVPWRCHRSLIGDALLVRGITVLDIMNEKAARAHELTSFAVVEGTAITYPGLF